MSHMRYFTLLCTCRFFFFKYKHK